MEHWLIHRAIGMGGDQLVGALAGEDVESKKGEAIRDAEKDLYGELIGEVRPFPEAASTLVMLRDRGFRVILASSAKSAEVDAYLDMLTAQIDTDDTDIREVIDGWTTSADVEATKPEPDLMRAALQAAAAAPGDATMIGDSIWDVEAARRAGIPAVGVLSGGFARAELEGAGAVAVADTFAGAAEALRDMRDAEVGAR